MRLRRRSPSACQGAGRGKQEVANKRRPGPTCHRDETERWLAKPQAELLACPYFHITVTVSAELRGVRRSNRRAGDAVLMGAAAEAIAELARDRRYVGGTVGVLAVLQPGRSNSLPPHRPRSVRRGMYGGYAPHKPVVRDRQETSHQGQQEGRLEPQSCVVLACVVLGEKASSPARPNAHKTAGQHKVKPRDDCGWRRTRGTKDRVCDTNVVCFMAQPPPRASSFGPQTQPRIGPNVRVNPGLKKSPCVSETMINLSRVLKTPTPLAQISRHA